MAGILKKRHRQGRTYSVVVVAEGVAPPPGREIKNRLDAFGFERLGGVAYQIAPELEQRTGFETRVTVLGHLQRGGTPTAFDRVLGTRFGAAAADMALNGRDRIMVAVQGDQMVTVPLEEACRTIRGVDETLYELAATFFN